MRLWNEALELAATVTTGPSEQDVVIETREFGENEWNLCLYQRRTWFSKHLVDSK